eukprot:snap_masked-scaffold_4-processed-gene-16.34-mRNA-1 protein AED:0.31 eAED:0.31 QI:0/-1/0/1/-1/1/1/0/640
MKVIGLISGGKDSLLNLLECVLHGHEIICLCHLTPPKLNLSEEMDSYMFQTVGSSMVQQISKAMKLPLLTREITKGSKILSLEYKNLSKEEFESDEINDLFQLLVEAKSKFPEANAVSSGAILSTYQRNRVEYVCKKLNLSSVAFLWQLSQIEVLNRLKRYNFNAILVKVASLGLKKEFLGKSLDHLTQKFMKLNQDFGFHVCGEGGEYETLVLDCPLFEEQIVVDEKELIVVSEDIVQTVAHLYIKSSSLKKKFGSKEEFLLSLEELKKKFAPSFSQQKNPLYKTLPEVSSNQEIHFFGSSNCFHNFEVRSTPLFISNVDENSASESMESILEQLKQQINKIQVSLDKILFVNLYLRDMSSFNEINKTYSKFFSQLQPASRSCVQIDLPKGVSVAAQAFYTEKEKKYLHVQSYSDWAPLCIGPYCQATSLEPKNLLFIAGQIGLVPSIMELAAPNEQLRYCVEHVDAVAKVHGFEKWRKTCVSVVVYVSATREEASFKEVLEKFMDLRHCCVIVSVPKLPKYCCYEVETILAKYSDIKQPSFIKLIEKFSKVNEDFEVYFEKNSFSFTIHASKINENFKKVLELLQKNKECISFIKAFYTKETGKEEIISLQDQTLLQSLILVRELPKTRILSLLISTI